MIKRKYNKQIKNTKHEFKHKNLILGFIVLTLIIIFALEILARPSIKNAANYQAKIIATQLISETTYEQLDRLKVSYDNIAHIKTDSNGAIIAIETDMNYINKLKSTLSSEVTKKLHNLNLRSYNLSIGTLTGNEYLSGRGPKVNLKIEPTGYLTSELVSKFSSAGINQTHHQIILNLTLDITTYLPLSRAKTQVSTNYIIAETVIVGEVPQYYTSVISDDRSLISDINDYDAKNNPSMK